MSEIRTEYGVRSTQLRHGKRTVVFESSPGREADRAFHEHLADAKRAQQEIAGLTPDAVLVSRTVTVSDWYAI